MDGPIRLDRAAVERYLDTREALDALMADIVAQAIENLSIGLSADFLAEAERRSDAAAALLAERGYTSEAWGITLASVQHAYWFSQEPNPYVVRRARIRDEIEDVRADRALTEDDRRDLLASLEAELAETMVPSPLPENLAAVAPFLARIRATVERR